MLCILFGCKLPTLLQPQAGETYQLVAFTYTFEIMDGEFLRGQQVSEV
jgi:hypothetical protein